MGRDLVSRQRVYHPDVLIGHDAVSGIAWDQALRGEITIGFCPRDQHPLKPGEPYEIGRTIWYPATCSGAGCTFETAGHGPRPPKKSETKEAGGRST